MIFLLPLQRNAAIVAQLPSRPEDAQEASAHAGRACPHVNWILSSMTCTSYRLACFIRRAQSRFLKVLSDVIWTNCIYYVKLSLSQSSRTFLEVGEYLIGYTELPFPLQENCSAVRVDVSWNENVKRSHSPRSDMRAYAQLSANGTPGHTATSNWQSEHRNIYCALCWHSEPGRFLDE